jgi:hypothetical protein
MVQLVTQRLHPLGRRWPLTHCNLRRGTEADDSGRVQRAAAHASLMAATMLDRRQPPTAFPTHVQGADSLRSMHLVARKRQQVHPQAVNIQPAPGKQLGGIRMKHCPSGMRDVCNLRQRGKHAGLVVGCHHGHKQSVIVNGIMKAIKIDDPALIHWDQDHLGVWL